MFSGLLMAAPCENLMSMKFPDAKVTLAQTVAAGGFAPPGANPQAAAAFKDVPAFCRIAMTLTPSSDSDIRVEIWLPVVGKLLHAAGSDEGRATLLRLLAVAAQLLILHLLSGLVSLK
jgi:hypothetical protein